MATDDNGHALYLEEDVAAAHMAAELLAHFEALKALRWEPTTNRREIASHKREAAVILEALQAHLILTNPIRAIAPATTVRYDAAAKEEA